MLPWIRFKYLLYIIAHHLLPTARTFNFSKTFIFATTSSAYQIEGAWNQDGKGPSLWDHITHHTSLILDNSTGDITCDSYHKIHEDVTILKDLGVQAYHFSISWSRLLPDGTAINGIWSANPSAVEYYKLLINELIVNGITPIISLFSFDLPLQFAFQGGFQNPEIIRNFVKYADVVFQLYGHRVKDWYTINEPNQWCNLEIMMIEKIAAQYKNLGMFYTCNKHILLAHAEVFRMYQNKYRWWQYGTVSMIIDSVWYEPGSSQVEDIETADRFMQFTTDLWAHPIYKGDYPQIVKEYVSEASRKRGFGFSKLPKLSKKEIALIRGSSIKYGLRYHSNRLVFYNSSNVGDSLEADAQISTDCDSKGKQQFFSKMFSYLSNNYNSLEIMITGDGYADSGGLNDHNRVEYIKNHLKQVSIAITRNKVNIIGYTVYNLMDSFQWTEGYARKYGLYSIDFNDFNKARIGKSSAKYYKQIILTKTILN